MPAMSGCLVGLLVTGCAERNGSCSANVNGHEQAACACPDLRGQRGGPGGGVLAVPARVRSDGGRTDAAGSGADEWACRRPVRAGDGRGGVDRRVARGDGRLAPRPRWSRSSVTTAVASTSSMRRLVAGISGRHTEVMRGALAATLHEATRDDVEYRFEDSIRHDRARARWCRGHLRARTRRPGSTSWSGPTACTQSSAGGLRSGAWVPTVPGRLSGDLRSCRTISASNDRMVVWNVPGRLAAVYPVRGDDHGQGRILVPPRRGGGCRSP